MILPCLSRFQQGILLCKCLQIHTLCGSIISPRLRHNNYKETILHYRLRLKACSNIKGLDEGMLTHSAIIGECPYLDFNILNTLLEFYVRCECMKDAWALFNNMVDPDPRSCSLIIEGFCKNGQGSKALELFERALCYGPRPCEYSITCVLKVCSNLGLIDRGKLVHTYVIKVGLEKDKFIGSTIVNLYTKCGQVDDAFEVFNKFKCHSNVVAWSCMILGYAEHRRAKEAIKLFKEMEMERIQPNEITFLSVLKACSDLGCLVTGRRSHIHMVKLGICLDVLTGSTLVDVYATCGSLVDAFRIFDDLHERNVVSWSTIITGHQEHGYDERALELYNCMQQDGILADAFLFVSVLKACTNLERFDEGKAIHVDITKIGVSSDLFLASALVDMYSKCGNFTDAREVLDELSERDVVAWCALIAGFASYGNGRAALEAYQDMQQDGVKPNEVTFVNILKACSRICALEEGRIIHSELTEQGFDLSCTIGNTLVDLYAKCGSIADAHRIFSKLLFKDTVSWNAMIACYADHGQNSEALQLYSEREQEANLGIDECTFLATLKACSGLTASEKAKVIHADVVKHGLEGEVAIGNTLINMYSSCGYIQDAFIVFDQIKERSAVSWNAIIAGCAEHGCDIANKTSFWSMQNDDFRPDEVTFVSLLSGCNHAGLVEEGYSSLQTMFHSYSLIPTIQHFICMIDILGRAGRFAEAKLMVDYMPFKPDCFVCMALMSSCDKHGFLEGAVHVFNYFLGSDISTSAYVLMSNVYTTSY